MRLIRLTVLIAITVGILYALFGVYLVILKPLYDDYSSRVPFDKNTWSIADGLNGHPYKVQMIDNLLTKNDFHGKTRDEITTLLGEPVGKEKFQDWDMEYWLGPERGFLSIDSEWLVFRLNKDSSVIDYQLVRD